MPNLRELKNNNNKKTMKCTDWSRRMKLAARTAIKPGIQPCPSHSFRGHRGERFASYKEMARRSGSRNYPEGLWTKIIEADDQEVSEAGDPKESGRIETRTLIDGKGMKKREGARAFGLNRINRSIQDDEPRCGTLGNKLK